MTLPHRDHPSPFLTFRFRGGFVVTAPADYWFSQPWARALIEVLFGHTPPPIPDDEYAEFIGDQVEQVIEAGDPDLAVFGWQIDEQQRLAAAFVERGEAQ